MNILILVIAGSFAQAAKYTPLTLETKLGIYQLDLNAYHVGYSTGVLNNGFPIGRYAKRAARSNPASAGTAAELEQYLRNSTEENNRTMDQGAKNRQARLQEFGSSASGGSSNILPTPLATPTMDLKTCLEIALVALKNKISSEAVSSERSIETAEMILNENRGAGGLPCGQTDPHLKNVVPSSSVEQIKILSALAAREGEERARILDITELAFSSEVSAEVRGLHINVWRRLSLAAVFSAGPLPSTDQIVDQIEQSTASQPFVLEGMEDLDFKIILKKSVKNAAAARADGQRFLKVKYGN